MNGEREYKLIKEDSDEVKELRGHIRHALFELQEVINKLCEIRDKMYIKSISNGQEQ